MKHCPECNKNYADPTLSFCLQDGAPLIYGSAIEEPATAILSGAPQTEAETRTFEASPPSTTRLHISSRRRSFKIGIFGILLVTVFGIGGYVYYGRASSRQLDSIAVMPFVNESGDPQVEYLTDGMTDTLIRSLSELPNIKVKARTSVFRYKGKEVDPKVIGKELVVQAIINGRVSQRDNRTSVAIEVVDTETEDVIFSTKYDKPQSELVTLQSDIARDVSGKLARKLSGSDEAKVSKTYTADPEAYQLYLKGKFFWNKRGHDNLLQAAEYFNKAIQRDPGFALAYGGLALTYALYPDYNVASPADSYPKSYAAARQALELDDSLAEPHATLGNYYCLWEWNYVKAEQEFRRASELNPNYATAHHWLSAGVLVSLKRFDEAISEAKKAQEVDPLSPIITVNLGDMYGYARRTDEAIDIYRQAAKLDPSFCVPFLALGNALSAKGQYPEAVSSFRQALKICSGDAYTKGLLAAGLARAGQRDEAVNLIKEVEQQAKHDFVRSDSLVFPYIALGNKEEAFVWLEKMVNEHGVEAVLLGVDPLFDDLRGDPRFKALLKRMNLPE